MTGSYDYDIKRELERSRKVQETLVEQQAKLIEIFTAMAADISALRKEMSPKTIDKPRTPLSGGKP